MSFPCQVSRLTDLPRVINFPLDTLGNETFVPRVERQRGWAVVQAGIGASQAGPSIPATPLPGRPLGSRVHRVRGCWRESAEGQSQGRLEGPGERIHGGQNPTSRGNGILAGSGSGPALTASWAALVPELLRFRIEPIKGIVQMWSWGREHGEHIFPFRDWNLVVASRASEPNCPGSSPALAIC